MLSLLEQASTQSLDPLEDGAESLVVAYRVRQPGGRGRPRLEFDSGFLALSGARINRQLGPCLPSPTMTSTLS